MSKMKIIFLLLIVLSSSIAIIELPKNSNLDLKDAITTIMKSFYCQQMRIDLTTMNNKDEIQDMVDEILPIISQCATVRMASKMNVKRSKKAYNLLLLKNFGEFESFVGKMSSENFDRRGFYTAIFIHNIIDLRSLFKLAWNASLTNFNIVVKSNASWEFFTYFPFSESICGNTKPFYVNLSSNFFENKIKNFHECPLSFPKLNYYPGLIIENNRERTKISGIDGDIMTELKGVLNFTLKIVKLRNEEERWGAVYQNGSSNGAVGMVINRETDFMLGFMALTLLRTKHMDATSSFTSWPFVLIVPHGAEFSPFENLFRPFSIFVWCLLILSFLSGFLFIFMFRRYLNPWCKKQIFGEAHHVPYLNMMNIFFGGSLHILPSNHVARMLLMSFILYCLVMRNLYQGFLFKFLQSNDRKRPVMTVDEMMERKFNFYMYPVYLEHAKTLRFFKRKKVIKDDEADLYHKMTLNPSFKGGICSSLDEVLYLNKLNFKNFTYRVLPEYLYNFNYVIYFQKDSPYLEAFNDKMNWLKSGGIIDYLISKYLNTMYLNEEKIISGPRKLSVKNLSGAFQAWLIGCAISFIVFIAEKITQFMIKLV